MEHDPEKSLHVPSPSSISPPSEKRQKISSDKAVEQCAADGHSSECTTQIILYKDGNGDRGQDEQGENVSLVPFKPSKQASKHIGAYAVQCVKCMKWRLVPTKEQYEALRERILQIPFMCEKAQEWKPDVTCDDPSDVSQDGRIVWAMDKPNIAQAPPGWERLIRIRSEGSTRFADVYYISPTGKKLRSSTEIKKYLADNPEYGVQGVVLSQFSFKIPAPLQRHYAKKRAQTCQNDGTHTGSTEALHLEEVQPIAWAAQHSSSVQPISFSVADASPAQEDDPEDNNQLEPEPMQSEPP